MGPPSYIIVRFLLLEALEDDLVFSSDFHEFTLASLSIQTLFELNRGSTGHALELLGLGDTGCSTHSLHGIEVCIGV